MDHMSLRGVAAFMMGPGLARTVGLGLMDGRGGWRLGPGIGIDLRQEVVEEEQAG